MRTYTYIILYINVFVCFIVFNTFYENKIEAIQVNKNQRNNWNT